MTDEEIISLYFSRSENAIHETAAKYGRLCTYVIKNILKDPADIDECVNDTYLGAWNSIPPSKPDVLSSYLCKIARNLALKKHEYLSAQKRNPEVLISLSELEECITDFNSSDIRYSDKELSVLINRFLRSQKQEARVVFIRRYWFNDSIKDICQRYHMSKSKVESLLFRTRSKLRETLQQEGYDI
ncbi:MAG: sigma-70 family RNA polymerase sigma factor [Lachnospiraceae bacterium]|nr:sigma-70 family RNA polymerase sigma factor [Lachnospiraceae bacterium]